MDLIRKIKKLLFEIGILPFLIIIFAVSLLTIILLLVFDFIDSKLVIGFIGVIIGSAISSITSIVISKESRKGQLAVASLEKRLEAHQTAYSIWRNLISSVHDEEKLSEISMTALDWWEKHCLYLDPESREAFRASIFSAGIHKDLLREPRSKESLKSIKENWATIMKPGKTLVEGVYLPSLAEDTKPDGINSGA
jgi:hypothetical protein